MKPDRQSAKARLHSRMLLGLCKTGVLTTAIMATRLLREAIAQNGTFTAAKTTCLMSKEAVSLTGITSSATRPQMPLFQSEIILLNCTGCTNVFAKSGEIEKKAFVILGNLGQVQVYLLALSLFYPLDISIHF